MQYNYLFEIAAIVLMLIVLYDYRMKMRISRPDGVAFQIVILASLAMSISDVVSSVLILWADRVSVELNVFVAVVFFVSQATMIFALAYFSFLYMNPRFSWRSVEFAGIFGLYAFNVVLGIGSVWQGWYFRFDEQRRYVQGPWSDYGYFAYYLNVVACLLYAIYHRRHILKKDLAVAGIVASFVCVGVTSQLFFRNILVIGFTMGIVNLYLYMTLENPNDYQDRLTHCTNNYGFKIFITSRCAMEKPYTIIFLDIKKFRYINTIFGEEMGNHLLQLVELSMEKICPHHLVFRVNDDVFAIALYGNKEQTARIVRKIEERFEEAFFLPDDRGVHMDAVLAVCEYPTHFRNHTELLELRNYMMAQVKGTHKGNVIYADEQMTKRYRRREDVEHALRSALEDHRLEVYYQPILDSESHTFTTAEALSRLKDPQLGTIPPDEFIAVAEKTGLIIDLGFYVLENVCEFIETRLLTNPANTIQNIHVNISTLQCVYPSSNQKYLDIMKKHHVPTEMIHFELTESTMVASPDLVKETMEELIAAGVGFSLDDYGTGYSNISYLVQFPFDKVKFDKHMVWSFFEKKEARLIMTNEFRILRVIGKEVIVEGVETKEQYDALRLLGIHLFQGYFFSRPVPADECVALIQANEDR